MEFNEKLIKLRKEKLLSQEELGYELNVTRQTISKWELGQTTPDMDKLSDISNFFQVSIDSLLKGNDEKNTNHSNTGKKDLIIGIMIFLILLLLAAFIYYLVINVVTLVKEDNDKKATNQIVSKQNIDRETGVDFAGEVDDKLENVRETNKEITEPGTENSTNYNVSSNTTTNTANANFSQPQAVQSSNVSEFDKASFNNPLQIYLGSQIGFVVNHAIDTVTTSNQTKERVLTVIYSNIATTDSTELRNLKSKFDQYSKYEIYFEYDVDGFINKMIIENR